jgi:hypothetical protein
MHCLFGLAHRQTPLSLSRATQRRIAAGRRHVGSPECRWQLKEPPCHLYGEPPPTRIRWQAPRSLGVVDVKSSPWLHHQRARSSCATVTARGVVTTSVHATSVLCGPGPASWNRPWARPSQAGHHTLSGRTCSGPHGAHYGVGLV